MISLEEVIKRKNENPDNVYKVPIKTGVLNLIRRILAECGPNRNDREDRNAAEYVKPVKTGDNEKARGELRHSPWIMGQPRPFFNEMAPFERLAPEKYESADDRQHEKSKGKLRVGGAGRADSHCHDGARGNKNESHKGDQHHVEDFRLLRPHGTDAAHE